MINKEHKKIYVEIDGLVFCPAHCNKRMMIKFLSFIPEYKSNAPTVFRRDTNGKIILFPTPLNPERMLITTRLELSDERKVYKQKALPVKRPKSKI